MKDLLQAKEELMREFFVTHYSQATLDTILRNHNSCNEFMHVLGKGIGLYTGNYDPNTLPKILNNNNSTLTSQGERYVNSESIKYDRVDRKVGSYHFSDYIPETGTFSEGPWYTKAHCAMIAHGKGFFGYSPTVQLRALFILYGEELLDYLDFNEEEKEKISVKLEKEEMRVPLYDIIFNGRTVTASITSASGKTTTEHNIEIMQPLLDLGNNRIDYYEDFIRVACGCQYFSKGTNAQGEYKKNFELCKHLIALLIGIKKGKEFLEMHGHEVIKLCMPKENDVSKINALTLYETLERPLLSSGKINPIFKTVNTKIARGLYLDEKPGYEIDSEILNTYGELILTPLLHWLLINNQRDFKERLEFTCIKGGNVDIRTDPITYFMHEVKTPLPLAVFYLQSNSEIIKLRSLNNNEKTIITKILHKEKDLNQKMFEPSLIPEVQEEYDDKIKSIDDEINEVMNSKDYLINGKGVYARENGTLKLYGTLIGDAFIKTNKSKNLESILKEYSIYYYPTRQLFAEVCPNCSTLHRPNNKKCPNCKQDV